MPVHGGDTRLLVWWLVMGWRYGPCVLCETEGGVKYASVSAKRGASTKYAC